MSLEFLNNYLTIIIFLAIALLLSLGFVILNYLLMSVVLNHLMILEWNLILDFT